MSFKTKKVKSRTLGEYLRECREHSGLPLSDIAKLCQVQSKYILALEEGSYQNLPAPVYVKGFLKSLGIFYRIPLNTLLTQYLNEQEIAQNIEQAAVGSKKTSFSAPKFIFSPKTVLIGLLAGLGVLSFFYLYFQVSSLGKPPRIEIEFPRENLTVNSGLIQVLGKTESGSTVYINNQMIVADAQGEFRENLSLVPGSNVLTIKAVNKFGESSEITRTVSYKEKEVAGVTTGTPHTAPEKNLIFEVVMGQEAAFIQIVADGIEKYSGAMLPNTRQTIAAEERIVLTTGNAGTTKVIFDGKDLGFLGKQGEVIRDIEFMK